MKALSFAGWVFLSMPLVLGAPALAQEKGGTGARPPSAAQPGAAEVARMEALRQKLKTDKKYIVSENMDLTDAEAKSFWPLYDAYQRDLDKLNRRIENLISTYADASANGPLPNDVAKRLIAESLDIEKAELDAKREMLAKAERVLPAHKVARYAQLENKIRALVRYELATEIPLAE